MDIYEEKLIQKEKVYSQSQKTTYTGWPKRKKEILFLYLEELRREKVVTYELGLGGLFIWDKRSLTAPTIFVKMLKHVFKIPNLSAYPT